MKKLIAILCTLCMIATMMPFSAFAVESAEVVRTFNGEAFYAELDPTVDKGKVQLDENNWRTSYVSSATAGVTAALGGKVNDAYATLTGVNEFSVQTSNNPYSTRYFAVSVNAYGRCVRDIWARLNSGSNKVSLVVEGAGVGGNLTNELNLDMWNNVFFVFDSHTKNMKTYVNGELYKQANLYNTVEKKLKGIVDKETGTATANGVTISTGYMSLKSDFRIHLLEGTTAYIDDLAVINSNTEPTPHPYVTTVTSSDADVSGNTIFLKDGAETATISAAGATVMVSDGTSWTQKNTVKAGDKILLITSTPYGNIYYPTDYYVDVPITGAVNDKISWSLSGGKLTISGTGAMPDYTETAALPWYNYISQITSAVIEDGITYVGERSFQQCASLTTVEIADTVTSIGGFLFNSCSKLETVKLSNNLDDLDNGTFNRCYSLKELTIPCCTTLAGGAGTSSKNAFEKANANLELKVYEDSYAYNWAVSSGKDGITPDVNTMTLTNTSTAVAQGVAYEVLPAVGGNVTEDGSITWTHGAGVLTISGTGAMPDYKTTAALPWTAYRTHIKSAVIEDGITYVGERSFQECKSLTTVEIADTVTAMGTFVFNACENLASVKLPANLTSIPSGTFNNAKKVKELTVPYNATVDANSFTKTASDIKIYVYIGSAAQETFGSDLTIEGILAEGNAGKDAKYETRSCTLVAPYEIKGYNSDTKAATISNVTGTNVQAKVIFVDFNGGSIESISLADASAPGEYPVNSDENFKPSVGGAVSVFVWDNMTDLTPLANVYR